MEEEEQVEEEHGEVEEENDDTNAVGKTHKLLEAQLLPASLLELLDLQPARSKFAL